MRGRLSHALAHICQFLLCLGVLTVFVLLELREVLLEFFFGLPLFLLSKTLDFAFVSCLFDFAFALGEFLFFYDICLDVSGTSIEILMAIYDSP